MNRKNIKKQVEDWIIEDLPQSAGLKVVKKFDGLVDIPEEEREAYNDFRAWYMGREYELIRTIPKPVYETDCWEEDDNACSFAYGSMNFQALKPPFNKYNYRLKKIYERTKDLADTYSAISHKKGKHNTYKRFKLLVEQEFKDQVDMLIDTLKKYSIWVNKSKIMKKISELNIQIIKCNQIWEKHAYEE